MDNEKEYELNLKWERNDVTGSNNNCIRRNQYPRRTHNVLRTVFNKMIPNLAGNTIEENSSVFALVRIC